MIDYAELLVLQQVCGLDDTNYHMKDYVREPNRMCLSGNETGNVGP